MLSAVESSLIIALLRNQTVTIHSLVDLDRTVQTISLDPDLRAFTLSYSPYGIAVRDTVRDERMAMVRMPLLGERLVPTIQRTNSAVQAGNMEDEAVSEDPPSGSGLTPPSTPPRRTQPTTPSRGSSLFQNTAIGRAPFSTAIAETLVVGPNGVQALAPTPVILRVENRCTGGQLEEAIALVDEERRKGRRGEIDADKVSLVTSRQATG
jgi:hypothetical protein